MDLRLWTVFVVTETALCITPGPAVLFVVAYGLSRGRRAALAANAGILTANTIYFALSALGLSAVLLASATLFAVLTYAGAAYRVWLGVRTIRGSGLSLRDTPNDKVYQSVIQIWLRAAAVQLANPKAVVFFVALLPQFLDAGRPLPLQMGILTATSLAVEFAVLAAYGVMADRASRFARHPRLVNVLNGVSGAILIMAAMGLAISRST